MGEYLNNGYAIENDSESLKKHSNRQRAPRYHMIATNTLATSKTTLSRSVSVDARRSEATMYGSKIAGIGTVFLLKITEKLGSSSAWDGHSTVCAAVARAATASALISRSQRHVFNPSIGR